MWDEVKDMPDDDVYRMFYLDRHARFFEESGWGYVHAEMAKVGVNLRSCTTSTRRVRSAVRAPAPFRARYRLRAMRRAPQLVHQRRFAPGSESRGADWP